MMSSRKTDDLRNRRTKLSDCEYGLSNREIELIFVPPGGASEFFLRIHVMGFVNGRSPESLLAALRRLRSLDWQALPAQVRCGPGYWMAQS
jgi:hypothetical protein